MTLIITGPTCSGKTTLANKLASIGCNKIVPYTTRPIREGEQDGVDYHYISADEFFRMEAADEFFHNERYATELGIFSYGTKKSDIFSRGLKVLVAGASETMFMCKCQVTERIYVVYLNVPHDICIDRAKRRGDPPEETRRRIQQDQYKFNQLVAEGLVDQRLCSVNEISTWFEMWFDIMMSLPYLNYGGI